MISELQSPTKRQLADWARLTQKKFRKERLMRNSLLALGFLSMTVLFGCDNSDDSNSEPEPGPTASFSIDGATVTPANLTFDNTCENADLYEWDFGDGRSSIQGSPSMAFNEHGEYLVTLVATQSSTGRTDTARQDLTVTPGIVKLDSIWLEALPFTDEEGAGWDFASGPDLFFNFTDGDVVLLTTQAGYLTDLSPGDLPIYWYFSPEYSVSEWAETFYLDFWDDDDVSGNDYMGSTSFAIDEVIAENGYTNSVILENQSGTLRTRLILKWE
jgi:hypothetical protein